MLDPIVIDEDFSVPAGGAEDKTLSFDSVVFVTALSVKSEGAQEFRLTATYSNAFASPQGNILIYDKDNQPSYRLASKAAEGQVIPAKAALKFRAKDRSGSDHKVQINALGVRFLG